MKLNNLSIVARKCIHALERIEESLFSLSPSFYAMVSGAVIGAATNLVTGLVSTSGGASDTTILKLGILAIFLSAVSFGHISLILERVRARITEGDDLTKRYRLVQLISGQRKKLWLSVVGGLVTMIIGILLVGRCTDP